MADMHPVEEYMYYAEGQISLMILLTVFSHLTRICRQRGTVTYNDIIDFIYSSGSDLLSSQEIQTYGVIFYEVCFLPAIDRFGNNSSLLKMKEEFFKSEETFISGVVSLLRSYCREADSHPIIYHLQNDIEEYRISKLASSSSLPETISKDGPSNEVIPAFDTDKRTDKGGENESSAWDSKYSTQSNLNPEKPADYSAYTQSPALMTAPGTTSMVSSTVTTAEDILDRTYLSSSVSNPSFIISPRTDPLLPPVRPSNNSILSHGNMSQQPTTEDYDYLDYGGHYPSSLGNTLTTPRTHHIPTPPGLNTTATSTTTPPPSVPTTSSTNNPTAFYNEFIYGDLTSNHDTGTTGATPPVATTTSVTAPSAPSAPSTSTPALLDGGMHTPTSTTFSTHLTRSSNPSLDEQSYALQGNNHATITTTTGNYEYPISTANLTLSLESKEPISQLLAQIRKFGMDLLFPQYIHDQALICLYAAFRFHKAPICHRILMNTITLIKDSGYLPHLSGLSKTKIRGVLSILKQSEIIVPYSHSGEAVRIQFAPHIVNYAHIHDIHDRFLERYCLEHHIPLPDEYIHEILWMDTEDPTSQQRKCEEYEGLFDQVVFYLTEYHSAIQKTPATSSNVARFPQQQAHQPHQPQPQGGGYGPPGGPSGPPGASFGPRSGGRGSGYGQYPPPPPHSSSSPHHPSQYYDRPHHPSHSSHSDHPTPGQYEQDTEYYDSSFAPPPPSQQHHSHSHGGGYNLNTRNNPPPASYGYPPLPRNHMPSSRSSSYPPPRPHHHHNYDTPHDTPYDTPYDSTPYDSTPYDSNYDNNYDTSSYDNNYYHNTHNNHPSGLSGSSYPNHQHPPQHHHSNSSNSRYPPSYHHPPPSTYPHQNHPHSHHSNNTYNNQPYNPTPSNNHHYARPPSRPYSTPPNHHNHNHNPSYPPPPSSYPHPSYDHTPPPRSSSPSASYHSHTRSHSSSHSSGHASGHGSGSGYEYPPPSHTGMTERDEYYPPPPPPTSQSPSQQGSGPPPYRGASHGSHGPSGGSGSSGSGNTPPTTSRFSSFMQSNTTIPSSTTNTNSALPPLSSSTATTTTTTPSLSSYYMD